ncbi:MAG TPA: sensor domain-containing diguanylate cyclase, partial [Dehalococcoidia bacterium]|nr:sensor domain-containing diguanylate cyclase [Dehalococcoidia bacterium]
SLPPVLMSERDLINVHRRLDTAAGVLRGLRAPPGGPDLSGLEPAVAEAVASVEEYMDDKSALNFRDMQAKLNALDRQLGSVLASLTTAVAAQHARLEQANDVARLAVLASMGFLAVVAAVATCFVSRVIHQSFTAGEAERETLRATTQTLQYRNKQLSALYNVFSEITDTLSLNYVVSATLREARRLLAADMVVLRILRGENLEVAGAVRADGTSILDLPAVRLGEGPTGRVAKRGQALRIESGAQDIMNSAPTASGVPPRPGSSRMESGVIVPLIVGARVVGTLACWSQRPGAFEEQDERVLEMMASQVATAVIAAETTETSERRALQDPLTGLPNRRQLNEDCVTTLAELAERGGNAVVAMVDVDNFKRLNDEFGHRVGDVTLQKIASVMRNAMREGDNIYRYGGEEFLLIFRNAGAHDAVPLAERIRLAVESTPLTGDRLEPVGPVTISIGLALMPAHSRDINALIEMADKAMYRAKEAGRNRVALWEGEPKLQAVEAAA